MTPVSWTTASARRRGLAWAAVGGVGIIVAVVFWPRSVDVPPLPSHEDRAVAEAYVRARQEIVRQPRSADAWGRCGMTLLAHGDAAAAVPFFAQAERLNDVEYRWPFLQAMILLQGQPALAHDKARRAAALAPRHANVHVLAGEIAFLEGQTTEAKSAFEKAIDAEPDNPYAILGLARWHADQHHLDECRQQLTSLLGQRAVAKAAQTLYAEVLSRQGDRQGAHKALQQAQHLPDDPPRVDRIMDEVNEFLVGLKALTERTERLQQQGALGEAIESQKEATQQYPATAAAQLLLGKLYAQRARQQRQPGAGRHDMDQAQAALQKALQLDPDNMQIRFFLGLAFFEQRRDAAQRAQAVAHFRAVLARQPNDSLAVEHLADCRMLDGAWHEAAELYRRLIQLRPDLPESHAALAEARERCGDLPEAISAWLTAYRLAPENTAYAMRALLVLRRILG